MNALTKRERESILRRVIFRPYRDRSAARFALTMWDTGETDHLGKYRLGYRLVQREGCRAPIVLFRGEDFCAPPLHAVDSDETVKSLMCFLTLRPGDTDAEYVADYTQAQKDYCAEHAESLAGEVYARFGE